MNDDATAALTGNPAYDAVYAYIRGLGDHLPPDPAHRNAIIWRAVHAALDAGLGTCDATAADTANPALPDVPDHLAAYWPREGNLLDVPETLTEKQVDALRAAWVEHFNDHATDGTICIHSASRVAEALDDVAALHLTYRFPRGI